jgi:hypothetical protein
VGSGWYICCLVKTKENHPGETGGELILTNFQEKSGEP